MTDLVLHKIGSTFFMQNFLAHLYKSLAIEMFNLTLKRKNFLRTKAGFLLSFCYKLLYNIEKD